MMDKYAPYSYLDDLSKVSRKGRPPIHLWHPDTVTDIDIKITAQGDWIHEGRQIKRQRLAHLFASVLRLDADGEYYLVTPLAKYRIRVEEAPFMAILLDVAGQDRQQQLSFTTNMAEVVVADSDHAIRSGDPAPYIMVRDGLVAKLNRNVYYQLAELLVAEQIDEESWMGVWSNEVFFKIARKKDL